MRHKYTNEVKAAAMAALLEGQGVSAVAANYKLPVGTVKSWKAELTGSRSQELLAPDEKATIGDRIMRYLHASLETLYAQQAVFADPEWLEKQDAHELAILHGVLTDKTIRILEALGNASGGGQQ